MSTSKEPPCCNENSFGTPIGLHKIEEKIGSDAPIGTVFLNRECTNRHFSEFPQEESEKNLITSRILWLRGLEPGRNSGPGCDSYSRYIYLHGTNHEDRLGEPQSDGCVHLANRDIITLFNAADIHTLVWIG